MSTQAVALCRVSTKGQEDEGHSLESQHSNVIQAAQDLDTDVIRVWSLSKSRRKSRNAAEIKKQDLEEILAYCKQNKRVRYLIIR